MQFVQFLNLYFTYLLLKLICTYISIFAGITSRFRIFVQFYILIIVIKEIEFR
mgnify:CR=1 FL=1